MSNAPVQITATVNRPFQQAVEAYLIALEMGRARTTVPMPQMSVALLARLAREVATDMYELVDVLKNFNLTPDQYARIRTLPFFIHALEDATIEWTSAKNTYERLKLEAAVGLEDAMPSLQARMKKDGEALPGVVEAAKLFAKIAGVGEREQGQSSPGEKFTININLGDGYDLKYEKDVTPRGPGQISINTEGPGNLPPV